MAKRRKKQLFLKKVRYWLRKHQGTVAKGGEGWAAGAAVTAATPKPNLCVLTLVMHLDEDCPSTFHSVSALRAICERKTEPDSTLSTCHGLTQTEMEHQLWNLHFDHRTWRFGGQCTTRLLETLPRGCHEWYRKQCHTENQKSQTSFLRLGSEILQHNPNNQGHYQIPQDILHTCYSHRTERIQFLDKKRYFK